MYHTYYMHTVLVLVHTRTRVRTLKDMTCTFYFYRVHVPGPGHTAVHVPFTPLKYMYTSPEFTHFKLPTNTSYPSHVVTGLNPRPRRRPHNRVLPTGITPTTEKIPVTNRCTSYPSNAIAG